MESLIPAPANGEVRSVIKCLNAQSIAPIEIHHTGLVFEEFRVQIPVPTNLIGFFSWFSSIIKTNGGLDFHYHDPFDHYSSNSCH